MNDEGQTNEMNEEKTVNEPNVQLEEVMGRLRALESTNNRLLDENKKHVEKYRTLRDQFDNQVNHKVEELKEAGKFDELLKIEKQRNEELMKTVNEIKQDREKMEQNVFRANIVAQVSKHAPGKYVEDVINNLPMDMIEVDKENYSFQGLEEAIAHVKKEKPAFFATEQKHGMTENRPGYKPQDPKEKMKNMSRQDKAKLLAQAISQI